MDCDGLPSGYKLELREMNPTLGFFAAMLGSQVQPVTPEGLFGRARHLQQGRSQSPWAALIVNRQSVSHMVYFRCLPLHLKKNYCQELCLCLAK